MARKSRRKPMQEPIAENNAQSNIYPTAVYVRLSMENLGRDDNGATIENQKDVCREYISQCPDLQLLKVYEDNGWSGINMRRPAFEEMMGDVRSGVIKAIVVRDLSRFSRNYIEVGTYLEKIFPELGVRFISVKEQLDTLHVGDISNSLMVSLQNLINDFYSKDISRKVETALATQMREGTLRWRSVPYGYRRNEDRTNIVPDDERAGFVKQMFEWAAEGVSQSEIVRRLNEANAPRAVTSRSISNLWVSDSVRTILRNPVYIGTRIMGKAHTALYKGIKRECTPPEQWYVFPGAHEPLIGCEVFDKVQAIMDERAKKWRLAQARTAKDREGIKNLFHHKIFCGDCGSKMILNRRKRMGKVKGSFGRYICTSSASYHPARGSSCSTHLILQTVLEEKVLAVIRTHTQIALEYEKLIEHFRNSNSDRKNRKLLDKAIRGVTQKMEAVHRKHTRLYEDYVDGVLDAEEYGFAKKAYQDEGERLNLQLEDLVAEKKAYEDAMSPKNLWITLMRSVRNMEKLSQELVDAAIDRINVYEGNRIEVVLKYQDVFELSKSYLKESGESV